MKIVLINEWFSKGMGYAENFLPSELGKLGHDVHLITSDLQIYGNNIELYDTIYKSFLGDRVTKTGVFESEFYTLHRNEHSLNQGVHIKKLQEKLRELKPDIVYLFEILSIDFLNVVALKEELGFKIFSESRLHTSILHWPKKWEHFKYYTKMNVLGRKTSKYVSRYYSIARDISININLIYGIPKNKITLSSLGVDTDSFSSSRFSETDIIEFRKNMGFNTNDFICVYTGRLNEDKAPLILSMAVDYLNDLGYKDIKALFVGKGFDSYVSRIKTYKNSFVKDFVVNQELPLIYSSSNIGVWPKQESNSRLDAMACGLPNIVCKTLSNRRLVENCGYLFKKNNFKDLSDKILNAYLDRNSLINKSINSVQKIHQQFSWRSIAESRINDFENIL